MGKLALTCPYGNMTQIVPHGLGLNPYNSDTRDACLVNQTLYKNGDCDPIVDKTALYNTFNSTCKGKNSCSIDLFDTNAMKPVASFFNS